MIGVGLRAERRAEDPAGRIVRLVQECPHLRIRVGDRMYGNVSVFTCCCGSVAGLLRSPCGIAADELLCEYCRVGLTEPTFLVSPLLAPALLSGPFSLSPFRVCL